MNVHPSQLVLAESWVSRAGGLSGTDIFAVGIILGGILCHALHRRMPAGLGTSLFVGATTVGAAAAVFSHNWFEPVEMYWPAPAGTYVVCRVTSVLCAMWGFFGWLATQTGRGFRAHSKIAVAPPQWREHRRDAGTTHVSHRRDAGTTHVPHRRDAGTTHVPHRRDACATSEETGSVRPPCRTWNATGLPRPTGASAATPHRRDAGATVERSGRVRWLVRSPGPSETFFAWALVSGIAVVVLTVYVVVFASCSRLLNPDHLVEKLPASGLWNIIGLLTATLFWAVAVSRRSQPVLTLILLAILVWWTGLMIPSAVGTYGGSPSALLSFQPWWWTWTFQMQFGLAVVLLIAAVLQEQRYRWRRANAWPDRLDDLLEPYSRWPAYTQTEAVIAAVVLVLGVYQVVRPGPPSWLLAIASGVVALTAGVVCLFMTYRRWSPNTAGLGMALLTLSAVAVASALAPVLGGQGDSVRYAARLPVVCNAALLAVGVMVALWSWLGRFWNQQLLDGVPWTTTGRMIPYTERAAFLLTALAVLIAYQMVLWPRRESLGVGDDAPIRYVAGISALLFLALVAARNARRCDSTASATMSVALVLAVVLFVVIRLPASTFRGRLEQYSAVVYGVAALPFLLTAEWLPKTRWRCFSQPVWWLAVLVLPFGAGMELLVTSKRLPDWMTDLVVTKRLPADWVQPAALFALGVLYVVAGLRERRRAILVLGGVLLLASLSLLYKWAAAVNIW